MNWHRQGRLQIWDQSLLVDRALGSAFRGSDSATGADREGLVMHFLIAGGEEGARSLDNSAAGAAWWAEQCASALHLTTELWMLRGEHYR